MPPANMAQMQQQMMQNPDMMRDMMNSPAMQVPQHAHESPHMLHEMMRSFAMLRVRAARIQRSACVAWRLVAWRGVVRAGHCVSVAYCALAGSEGSCVLALRKHSRRCRG
jgi:hypothetical protein